MNKFKFLTILSKHPYDKIVHLILCFIPVCFGLAHWTVAFFVSVLVEYEQRFQIWYCELPLSNYLRSHVIPDLVADTVGIILGLIVRSML